MLSAIRKTNKLDSFSSIGAMKIADRQVFYHACLAMDVASWDGYINNVILEYHSKVGDVGNPSLLNYRISHGLLIKRRLEKFNTPNFDNTRTLIIECTGYDPVSIWSWPQRSMIWQAVQVRLNEILKIRHSFAHGLSFPTYNWLPQKNGQCYLNKKTVTEVEKLLVHLAISLDVGLKTHMSSQYGSNCMPWR
jgi:hypothetical protein